MDTKRKLGTIAVIAVLVIGGLAMGVMSAGDFNTHSEDAGESAGQKSVDATDVPAEVNESKPQAEALLEKAADAGYKDVRVFIEDDGNLVVYYTTSATSEESLEREFTNLGLLLAEIDGKPVGLTIVAGEVQGVIPEAAIQSYRNGTLDESAFKETLAYRDVSKDTSTEDQ